MSEDQFGGSLRGKTLRGKEIYGRRAIGQLVYKSFSKGGRGADFQRGLDLQLIFLGANSVYVFLLEIKNSAGLRPENVTPGILAAK